MEIGSQTFLKINEEACNLKDSLTIPMINGCSPRPRQLSTLASLITAPCSLWSRFRMWYKHQNAEATTSECVSHISDNKSFSISVFDIPIFLPKLILRLTRHETFLRFDIEHKSIYLIRT
ncbi:putative DNA binding protein [Ranid herpesvirus 3]|uniref:Putative DNA binding protein n=1 Tax=Ranid herpesvirus 3 TaxID=1987509 RepID=A0A1X9T5G9_9VIRU|nr:putative DNA binding protein [Ranid herpesvirus 3]ARR28949.1 putative DNA binding protein [Ranid herpesvirus 3]